MRLLPTLFVAVAALAGPAVSQAIDPDRLSEHVRVLASDDFEGRAVGTPGEAKTIAYLSEQFAAAGFSPGGVDGTWVQPVTLQRFEQSNVVSTLKVGSWSRPLVQGEQITVSSRLPGDRVEVANAPLVFVGYGVTAPERNWDDFKDVDLRGKVAVVLINDPDFEEPALATFGGRAMTYYGRWTYKYEELARRGAAGALIIHETAPASYGWATVKNSWTRPQFDSLRDNPAAERLAFEAWMTRDVAADMFRRVGLDLDALKRQARTREFRPVSLGRARIDVAFDLATTTMRTNNVIARLEGASRPDETILYTAHWDHLGRGAPDAEGDDIFNGALDNATGTAALVEIARIFAEGPRPQRSIVMIGFTAEESGLLGSEYYAINPVYPLARTVGGFNMDGLNVFGSMADIGVVGSGLSTLEDDLTLAAERQGRRITPDPAPEGGGYFRSDHFPLSKRGVPMLYAGGGNELVDGGAEVAAALRADYTRSRYHQVDDEWDPNWNLEGAVQDLTLLFELGASLANSDRWPEWKPGAEFKAARDATAGERP